MFKNLSSLKSYLLLVPPLIIGFCIRFFHAGDPFGGYLGSVEAEFALADGNHLNIGSSTLPSIYPAIIRLLYRIFGEDELTGRSLSIASSILIILATRYICKRLFSDRAGIYAAYLIAVAPVMVLVGRSFHYIPLSVGLLLTAFAIIFSIDQASTSLSSSAPSTTSTSTTCRTILCGTIFGLSVAVNLLFVIFLPPVILLFLRKHTAGGAVKKNVNDRYKKLAIFMIGAVSILALMIAPAIISGSPASVEPGNILPQSPHLTLLQTMDQWPLFLTEIFWGYSPPVFMLSIAAITLMSAKAAKRGQPLLFPMLCLAISMLLFYLYPDSSFLLMVGFPFAAIILAAWLDSWRNNTALIMVFTPLVAASAVTAILMLAATKLGRFEGFQLARYILRTSTQQNSSPLVVTESNIKSELENIVKVYCRKCDFFSYSNIKENGKNLDLDYSRDIYLINHFDRQTSPNPQISLLFKSTYGIVWDRMFLLFEPYEQNFFSVKKVRFEKQGERRLKDLFGLELVWEYPKFVFYRLPGAYHLLKEGGRATLARKTVK